MTASARTARLIDRLPAVRGRYKEQVPLARFTWFRVGGPAEIVFRPADQDDLVAFLRSKPADIQVTVIGVGSNVLVRDGGIEGVVVRLGAAFAAIVIDGTEVSAGAGALDANVALSCAQAGVAGLEFLIGVPGTIGGALRMNAGAYGGDMAGVTRGAVAIDSAGALHDLDRAAMNFTYRRCGVAEDWIFLSARLRGSAADPKVISARCDRIRETRAEAQPIRTKTGGSTFANPLGPDAGPKAWQLIEEAGCRGLSVGGAAVSEKHCNFLVNTGSATADDIERLGETVRARVAQRTGVVLEWEIRRLGRTLPRPANGGQKVSAP